MYEMIQNILYLNKIEKSKRMYYLNKIDAILNCQRIYLRIMKNNHWIDEKKFNIAIDKIYEIGKNHRRTAKILCQKQYEINLMKN